MSLCTVAVLQSLVPPDGVVVPIEPVHLETRVPVREKRVACAVEEATDACVTRAVARVRARAGEVVETRVEAKGYEKHAVATIDGRREERVFPDNDAIRAWMIEVQAAGQAFFLESIEAVPLAEGRSAVTTVSRVKASRHAVQLGFEVPVRASPELMVEWDTRIREAGVYLVAFHGQPDGTTRIVTECP